MPISLVRALTEKASTPAMPTAAMMTARRLSDDTRAALSRRGATLWSLICAMVITFSMSALGAWRRITCVPMPAGHVSDGEDVSDILFGQSRARTKPLLWEWRFNIAGHVSNRSPQLAIREGNWKLLMNPDRSRVELYDIPRDRLQADNLAAKHPEIVTRLSRQLLAWHAQLPGATLAMLQGCNHMPMMEKPRETAKLIEEKAGEGYVEKELRQFGRR